MVEISVHCAVCHDPRLNTKREVFRSTWWINNNESPIIDGDSRHADKVRGCVGTFGNSDILFLHLFF